MAHISEYSIVTYERKPGHWRAAIIPKARFGIAVRGRSASFEARYAPRSYPTPILGDGRSSWRCPFFG
jgi:hypothetical protein